MNERRQIRVEHIVPYVDQERTEIVRRASSFVAPESKQLPATIDAPAWLVERQPLDVANVWTPTPGAVESTSAMDRAKALRVRLWPFVMLWILLAVIVGVVVLYVAKNAPGAALLGLLTFTALTAFTYYRLNRTDYDYSREGTERHRLNTAADLAKMRMRHEQELRERALDIYEKTLTHDKGGRW
jgi:hypothetical protein